MKKRSKRFILLWGLLAVILVFLGYRGYCTFIRERNVFDQMYYSRVHKSTELDWFIDYRRLFKDMPQLRTPQWNEDDVDIWMGNMVFEFYDDNYLEDGHEIRFTFYVDEPSMYITYRIRMENGEEWYTYRYDVDKKILTYNTSDPENMEMKNFLFDRVLPDWFAANQGRTRFSIENLGEYTLIDTPQ